MKRTEKKTIAVLAAAVLLIVCITGCAGAGATPATPSAASDAVPLVTVVMASDFQNDGTFFMFRALLDQAAASGVPTPDCALFGGDYSIKTEQDPDDNIRKITDELTGAYPEFLAQNAIFVQGNHDNLTSALAPTGAHDMGAFIVYSINEDDFPSGQTPEQVEKTLQDLDSFLSDLVKQKDSRPVIVAGHLPLHDSQRADNACGGELAELLNSYGHRLDIVYLFGHSHSGSYDDSIGGSVNYVAKGESLYVPVPAKSDSSRIEGSRKITLAFSYLNYGYVGYSNNTESAISTNVLTLGVLQVYPESIEITRYTAEGKYCTYSIALQNTQTAQNAA